MIRQLGRWLLLGCVLWGLSACSGWGGPPQQAIAAAVTRQAQLTQQQLWQSLGSTGADTAPTLKVDRIHPRRTRRLSLAGRPVYAVEGSYRFSIQYPSHRSSQSQIPFSVWLQPSPNGEQWQWLRSQPQPTPDEQPHWQRETLPMTP
ncbi:MAG: hypothetical protein VKJ09_14130 [Leptolyngbya sp.]|nr:hypothetical protein [Leptolyngbya sp.]